MISLPVRASKTSTFIDSNGDDDLFHGFLDTHSTPAKQIAKLPDEYVKYITKEKVKSISNLLQWWRNYQSTFLNLAQNGI